MRQPQKKVSLFPFINEGNQDLCACVYRIYEETGMILKFAIGEVPAEYEAAIQQEESAHGSFLRIPIERVSGLATDFISNHWCTQGNAECVRSCMVDVFVCFPGHLPEAHIQDSGVLGDCKQAVSCKLCGQGR